MGTVPASGQTGPPTAHLSVAWEIALISALVVVIIAVIIVVIFFNRKKTAARGVELGDNARNGPATAASISNKRKRKRNKARKVKTRDSDATVDLEGGGIEEVADFEEDPVSLWMDVGTRGVSGSESCDVHKPIR